MYIYIYIYIYIYNCGKFRFFISNPVDTLGQQIENFGP